MLPDPSPDLERLRHNNEFASITQFFHTFHSAFQPWPTRSDLGKQHSITHSNRRGKKRNDSNHVFNTEDLERMILDKEETSCFVELLTRMLRILTRNRFINEQTWQTYFAREIDKRENLEAQNPFRQIQLESLKSQDDKKQDENEISKAKREENEETTVGFFNMALETRVHLLYILCEWQLDEPERLREHLNNEHDAVHWRVEPIGFDRKGAVFWLFDDNRLYKETPEPKPKKKPNKTQKSKAKRAPTRKSSRKSLQAGETSDLEEDEEWRPWQLVCLTSEQWERFPERYANSTHPDERNFHALLVETVLPKVLPAVQERESTLQKEEAIANRKRSSRILYRELEALQVSQLGFETETLSRSSRREKLARKRGDQIKEEVVNSREYRARERERRIREQEEMALAHAHRQAIEESIMEQENTGSPPQTDEIQMQGKKQETKPKAHHRQHEDNWLMDCVQCFQ